MSVLCTSSSLIALTNKLTSGDHVCIPQGGVLTQTRTYEGAAHPDGVSKNEVRPKILHYRRLYVYRSDPIVFILLTVNTSARLYHDFILLLFLHAYLGSSALVRELPEEVDQFRFFARLAGSGNDKKTEVTERRVAALESKSDHYLVVWGGFLWSLSRSGTSKRSGSRRLMMMFESHGLEV